MAVFGWWATIKKFFDAKRHQKRVPKSTEYPKGMKYTETEVAYARRRKGEQLANSLSDAIALVPEVADGQGGVLTLSESVAPCSCPLTD